jgi:hypothetical protein
LGAGDGYSISRQRDRADLTLPLIRKSAQPEPGIEDDAPI